MSSDQQPVNNAVVRLGDRYYSEFGVRNGIHCVPVDEEEEQISDSLNRLLGQLLGNTVLAPLTLGTERNPSVLDCGYGKGAWIDDLLGEYSGDDDLEITGIDIFTGRGTGSDDEDEDGEQNDGVSEFIKERWNLNVSFRHSTLATKYFHLVNSRMLADGIDANRWPTYIRELFALLRPMGWLQMVEPYLLFQSNNGSDAPSLQEWWTRYSNALAACNKNARVGQHLGQLMISAGFEHVQSSVVRLPIGNWESNRVLGQAAMQLFASLLRSHSMWLFIHSPHNMSLDQYEALLYGALIELNNPSLQLYINIYVAYGRRPRRS